MRWGRERYRPAGGSKIDTEAFAVLEAQTKKHYDTIVLPTMGTGATDMSNDPIQRHSVLRHRSGAGH